MTGTHVLVFGEAFEMKSNVDTVSICSDDTVSEVEWAVVDAVPWFG
jgi:hypothetical protein